MRLSVLSFTAAALAGLALVGSATADVTDINGLTDAPRTFNDNGPAVTNLAFVNSYPVSLRITETLIASPTGFANRHIGWFSTNGGGPAGNRRNFNNYNEAFDISVTMTVTSTPSTGAPVEAGFEFDKFGFGRFGSFGDNGRIEAGGSILPYYNFGPGIFNNGTVQLRMIHRPGTGDGTNPIGMGTPSSMEYMYNTGSGWVTSGLVPFNNIEGGIVTPFGDFNIGVGVQNNWGAQGPSTLASSDVLFTNFGFAVPAPGAVGLLAVGGLVAARRRRN